MIASNIRTPRSAARACWTTAYLVGALICAGCVERTLDLVPGAPSDMSVGDASARRDMTPIDLSRPADLAQAGTSCVEIADCTQQCETEACFDDCRFEGTPAARQAFDAIVGCIEGTCLPLCEGGNEFDCDQCFVDVQSPMNACQGRPACAACAPQFAACGL